MRDRSVAKFMGRPLRAVLFDLDGTLFDTAADIAVALNRALAEFGFEAAGQGAVRTMIGRGAGVLIERVLASQGRAVDAVAQAAVLERFFHHYGELEELHEDTAEPFVGATAALRAVHDAGLRTAVVTNKHHRFAEALLNRKEVSAWVDILVGGDTCARRKPDPQPLLFACESLKVGVEHALMVGDSINDVLAARRANMPVVCVTYGYNEGRDPQTLDCDALIDDLGMLPGLIELGS